MFPFDLIDRFTAPAPEKARVAFLKAQPFAHRGLHGGGIVENSRAAFDAAIAGGFGIELDVQAAVGGEPFVFHDAELERLTSERGMIRDTPAADLDRILLRGTSETIPRLAEVLDRIGGRVPLLIEVKTADHHAGMLSLAVRRTLEGYRGAVAVMSFNPNVSRWFREHAPRIVRGLVVTEGEPQGAYERWRGRAERHFALWRAGPDFLAYDIRNLPSRFAAAQRARDLALVTWTVRTKAQEQTAFACADEAIFEKPAP